MGGIRGWFRVCEDQALQNGRIVRVCRQPSATDVVVIVAGVTFILLIARDFQELGLFGFSLKRRIEQQEKRTASVEDKLSLMNLRLDVDASASAAATANVLVVAPEQIQKLLGEIPEKKREFLTPQKAVAERPSETDATTWAREALTGAGTDSLEQVPVDEASKRAEIIGLWEQLDQLLGLTPQTRVLAFGPHDPLGAARARFVNLFGEEVELVRAIRNAAAHSRPIEPSVLEEALEMARELVRIARQGLIGG